MPKNKAELIRKISMDYALPLFLYFIVYVIYTFPLIGQMGDVIIGLPGAKADTPQVLSNLYLFKTGMAQGSVWHTTELFYPIGSNTYMHGFMSGLGLLYWLLGCPDAFVFLNIILIIAFLLTGLGAYHLAKKYLNNHVAALCCGFIYAFSAFKLGHFTDHYWFVINFTIPWYYLIFPSILRFEGNGLPRIQSYKNLILCLLLGIISASLDYYETFFLIYTSIFYVLYRYSAQLNWKPIPKTYQWGLILLLILGGSGIVDLLRQYGVDDKHGLYWGGDIAGFVLPLFSRFLDFDLLNTQSQMLFNKSFMEGNMFLGWSLILLFLYSVFLYVKNPNKSAARIFLYMSLLVIVLCLPSLRFFGHTIIKTPSAFLHYIPFLNHLRVPTRWAMLLYLFIPIFCFLVLSKNDYWRKSITLSAALLGLLLFIEYFPKPYAFFNKNHDIENALALKALPGDVMLHLPLGLSDGYKALGNGDTRHMYLQTIHHKKLLGGYFSRLSDEVFDLYTGDAVMQNLLILLEGKETQSTMVNRQQANAFIERFQPDIIYVDEAYAQHKAFQYLVQVLEEQNVFTYTRINDRTYSRRKLE